MIFDCITRPLFVVSICHFFIMCGMENTKLSVPSIIQGHSDYLKMLTCNKQADFHKNPLKWPNDSLVTQDELNKFAKVYQPNFDYNQLSSDELVATACFHDYFQMQLPMQSLQIALYKNIKTLKAEDIESLSLRWQHPLSAALIKDKRLDVQLLKAYSDSIIGNGKKITNNTPRHSVEDLLF